MRHRFLFLIILILFSGSGQVLIKKGVFNLDLAGLEFSASSLFSLIFRVIQNGWLLGGIFFLGLTFLLYLLILSRVQLHIIYPIFVSGTIIFVSLMSWLLFREFLNFLQLLGISFIIFGIFLMFSKRAAPSP